MRMLKKCRLSDIKVGEVFAEVFLDGEIFIHIKISETGKANHSRFSRATKICTLANTFTNGDWAGFTDYCHDGMSTKFYHLPKAVQQLWIS